MSGNKQDKRNLIILGVIIVLLVVGAALTSGKFGSLSLKSQSKITAAQAKTKAESFIKDYLLSDGTKFTVSDPKEYNAGLYQMDITIADNSQPIKSYMTKDGKIFLPQGMEMEQVAKDSAGGQKSNNTANDQTPASQAPKSDKPKVELFVMSYCPYGTQIEKGILPVAEALGNKVDFAVKFVDYAMHDKKEVDENLRQYCIGKDQSGKFLSYLKCFLKAGDSPSCLDETGIDQKKMNACVAATDKQYKITESFNNKSSWNSSFPPFAIYQAENQKYGVQGSPTLVINGQQVTSGRDSASLAKVICNSYTDGKKPAECDRQFASATPAPGFGEGTQSGSNSAANCAPAN